MSAVRRSFTTVALLGLVACSAADHNELSVATDSGATSTDAADSEGGPSLDGSASTTDAVQDSGEAVDGHVAPEASADAASDAGNECFLSTVGVFGQCITTAACAALGHHTSSAGLCPGAPDVECCTMTPDVADNPPVPAGWKLMPQSAVTPAMTMWAVTILHDATTYPMYSTAIQTFGALMVLARVEWHPPDFQNATVHRGVTLYQPG
jgi:hypothetical protein